MSYLAQFIKELKGKPYYILDTETTGLEDGEIVQIAIIDHLKNTILDTLIKPKLPIPADATAIHGIHNSDVASSPIWPDVSPLVREILEGQNIIIYNAVYDRRMMHYSAERHQMPKTDWKELATIHCAMEAYAEYFGQWNEYRGSYRWQRLSLAAASVGYSFDAHTALADCLATWHVVDMLLGQDIEKVEKRYRGSTETES